MKISTSFKLIGKGAGNLWRHKGSTFAAYISITIALLVLGFFALSWVNILNLTNDLLNKLEVRVFLTKPGTVKKIEELAGIEKWEYINADLALKQITESYQLKGDYLKNVLGGNPLQASYSLLVKDAQLIPDMVKTLKGMPEVDEVIYGGQTVDSLINLQKIIGGFGLLLLFILILAILLVVANTLRLSFAVRRQEIALEKLLGASPLYIVSPFLWEGTLLGLISAVSAIIILLYSYRTFSGWIALSFPYLPLKSLASLRVSMLVIGIVLGVIMGFIGSIWGVRRYWPKE